LRSTNPRNVPGIKDPKIDQLMDAALATSNIEERKKRYRELIDYIEPMHIYAFIGEKYVIDNTAVSRKVKGFRQDRYRVFKMDQVWME
jgi:ABC-type transport system substrate-binding protein